MTSASYARRAPEREILANLGHRSARLPARPPGFAGRRQPGRQDPGGPGPPPAGQRRRGGALSRKTGVGALKRPVLVVLPPTAGRRTTAWRRALQNVSSSRTNRRRPAQRWPGLAGGPARLGIPVQRCRAHKMHPRQEADQETVMQDLHAIAPDQARSDVSPRAGEMPSRRLHAQRSPADLLRDPGRRVRTTNAAPLPRNPRTHPPTFQDKTSPVSREQTAGSTHPSDTVTLPRFEAAAPFRFCRPLSARHRAANSGRPWSEPGRSGLGCQNGVLGVENLRFSVPESG